MIKEDETLLCENCHWVGEHVADGRKNHICRYQPPAITERYLKWPEIIPDSDWCGKHSAFEEGCEEDEDYEEDECECEERAEELELTTLALSLACATITNGRKDNSPAPLPLKVLDLADTDKLIETFMEAARKWTE